MQELLHPSDDAHREPQDGGARHADPEADAHIEEFVEPAQEVLPPEPSEAPGVPRLRRIAGHIARRLRLSRTSSAETTDPADEIFDDSVDEFGFPKALADAGPTNAGAEYWSAPRRTGEFIKKAPRFLDQVNDTSRTNQIEYVSDTSLALGVETQERETTVVSEHDTLVALRDFFGRAAEYTNTQGEHVLEPLAASMTENLTFIGEREYSEAVEGIAESWRQRLRSDATKQLCISAAIAKNDKSAIKSSAYLFDNIVKHFSDDELAEWKGRLVLDPSELTAKPDNVDIILLDDWTISGAQLRHSAQSLIDAYPEYKNQIEVQLVAASEERVQHGLKLDDEYSRVSPIPVNAYYAAHAADKDMASYSGAHITGAYCAVDYDFNDQMSRMAITMGTFMPPGTNIVRPYRRPDYRLTQQHRLRSS